MKHKTVLSFDDLRDDFSRYEVRPRSANQQKYWKLLKDDKKSIVIAHGPAGCGKTLLATQNGIDQMKLQKIDSAFSAKTAKKLNFRPDLKSSSYDIKGVKSGYNFYQAMRVSVGVFLDQQGKVVTEAQAALADSNRLLAEGNFRDLELKILKSIDEEAGIGGEACPA